MFEKINKVSVQNIAAILILATCAIIALYSPFVHLSESAERTIRAFFDMGLLGVIGWLFSGNKQKNQGQQ